MKIVALLFLSVFTMTGCLPEKESHDKNYSKVVIAGRTFKIPNGYFDGSPPYGRDTESVVLEYSLPGFEVLPQHPQYRTERQKLISEGRMRGMLLENASIRPPFEIPIQSLMRAHEFQKQDSLYGLEKYTHIVPKPLRPEPEYKPYHQDDLFIDRNPDGTVNSYLRCSPPKKHKIPSCRHRFTDKGILYEIHWGIQGLPNWKMQRDAAIEFIDGLEFKRTE